MQWQPAAEGSAVLRVEVLTPAKTPNEVVASWRIREPVRRGDAVLVRFYARARNARQESGEAMFNFYFQPLTPGAERSLVLPLTAGPEWSLCEIPFAVVAGSERNEATINFSFGALAQVVELAAIQVLNFGPRISHRELPLTRFTYPGREPGAAWRRDALERIERLRTAPLVVRVVDAAGQPARGARVELRLAQPDFLFGSAVSASLLTSDTTDARIYREKVVALFDTVTLDNDLKWPAWSRPERRAPTLAAVDWIETQHLRLRGHNVIWPGWKFTPAFVVKDPDRGPKLAGLIDARIRDVVAAMKGRVIAWDVINEPVHERDYFQHVPEASAAGWFILARSLEPEAQLFLNEYGMLNSSTSAEWIGRYLAFAERLRAAGAPIDGLGVQGHVGRQVRAPAEVLADLDLLAKAGLPVQITEFDLNTPDEALQADYTRDFLIACYSHPAVTGFTMWGFWQSRHWKPDAAMFRPDWSEKPNAAVWRDLVLTQWRTRHDGTVDAAGVVKTRGHFGRYQISATRNGVLREQSARLTRDGGEVVVTLP